MQFNRAIPGQSLTTPPKSAPYERPPQISDPLEAIDYHLEQLDDPKAVEELMFFLELGIDLSTLVEGVARKAVLDGIHSIDISLSIAPVIHEYIKGYADAMDIDYDEGFEDEEQDRKLSEARTEILARKFLAGRLEKQKDFELEDTDTRSDFRKRRDRQESFPEDVSLGMIKRMDEQVGIKRDAEGFPLKQNNERMTEKEYFATMGDLLDKRDENFYNIRNYGKDAMRGRSFGFPVKKGLMSREEM